MQDYAGIPDVISGGKRVRAGVGGKIPMCKITENVRAMLPSVSDSIITGSRTRRSADRT
jgi:hypothetical protein